MIKILSISYLLIASSLAIEVKVDKGSRKPQSFTSDKKSDKRDAALISSNQKTGYDYENPSHSEFSSQGVSSDHGIDISSLQGGSAGHINIPSDSYGTPLGVPLNEHSYVSHGNEDESFGNALAGGDYSQFSSEDHSFSFGGQSSHEPSHASHGIFNSYKTPSYSDIDVSSFTQDHGASQSFGSHGGIGLSQESSYNSYQAPPYTSIGVSSLGSSHGISSSYGSPSIDSSALSQSHGNFEGLSNSYKLPSSSHGISNSYGTPSISSLGLGTSQSFGSHLNLGSSSGTYKFPSSQGIPSSYNSPSLNAGSGSYKSLGSSSSQGISSSYGVPSYSSGLSHSIASQGNLGSSSGSYKIPSSFGISSSHNTPTFPAGSTSYESLGSSVSHGISNNHGLPSYSSGSSQSLGSHGTFGSSHGISNNYGSVVSHGSSLGGSFGSYGGPSLSAHGISSTFSAHKPSFQNSHSFGGISSSHNSQDQGPSYAVGHKGLRHYSSGGPSHNSIGSYSGSHSPSYSSSYNPSTSFFSSKGVSNSHSAKIIPMTFSKVPISSFSSYMASKPSGHQTAFKPSAYLGSISEDSYSQSHGSGYDYSSPSKSTYLTPKKTYVPSSPSNHGPPAASYGVPSSHKYISGGDTSSSTYYHH